MFFFLAASPREVNEATYACHMGVTHMCKHMQTCTIEAGLIRQLMWLMSFIQRASLGVSPWLNPATRSQGPLHCGALLISHFGKHAVGWSFYRKSIESQWVLACIVGLLGWMYVSLTLTLDFSVSTSLDLSEVALPYQVQCDGRTPDNNNNLWNKLSLPCVVQKI